MELGTSLLIKMCSQNNISIGFVFYKKNVYYACRFIYLVYSQFFSKKNHSFL